MQITVELRPHIGKTQTLFGPVDLEHDQWMVFATSSDVVRPTTIFLGYIGKKEGSAFNGYTTYRDLPPQLKSDVVCQVSSLVGWPLTAYEPSTSPVEEIDDEPDEEEDSD